MGDDSLEFSIIYIVIDPLPFFLANTPTFYHTKPCHISDLHPKRFNLVYTRLCAITRAFFSYSIACTTSLLQGWTAPYCHCDPLRLQAIHHRKQKCPKQAAVCTGSWIHRLCR